MTITSAVCGPRLLDTVTAEIRISAAISLPVERRRRNASTCSTVACGVGR
ncbi:MULTISPECIES: hypothetical protein [unclassified Mesorhizobium]|nr:MULTISPECIES: hypothetical protein [unclassified Mesorhizobium]